MKKVIFLAAAVMILVVSGTIVAYDWNKSTIDSPIWTFSFETSIVIDDSGKVHVTYDRGSNGYNVVLRHGIWDNGTYYAETVDSTGGAGIDNDITIDSFGHIHVVYCLLANPITYNSYPYYAYYDGTWNIQCLSSLGRFAGYTCNIHVDQNNYPHIATLTGAMSMSPTYMYYNGSNWQSQGIPGILDTDGMALDSQYHPIISSYNSSQNYTVTFYNGTNWNSYIVDPSSPCYESSIAIDNLGFPHVAYRCGSGGNRLKYGYFDGTSWHIEIVANIGIDPCITIDSSNYPLISYYAGSLKLAKWNGSSWEIEVVDNEGDVGRSSSLALDENNYPYIIYQDGTNHAVKFAYIAQAVSIGGKTTSIDNTILINNYPNPFNPRTTFFYCLPKSTEITLNIYNIEGQLIETLVNEFQQAGNHSVVWDAENMSSGIYFYRITTEGNISKTKKCVILK